MLYTSSYLPLTPGKRRREPVKLAWLLTLVLHVSFFGVHMCQSVHMLLAASLNPQNFLFIPIITVMNVLSGVITEMISDVFHKRKGLGGQLGENSD